MANAQLGPTERTVVHIDLDTKRILGFSPEGFAPVAPTGSRFESITLNHASAIESYANKFREQSLRDREETSLRRLEAERPMRQALKDAINRRNSKCDRKNVDINNALLKAMDVYYDQSIQARQKAEVCITAEKYEAGKLSTDLALDNPKVTLREGNA